MMLKVNRIKDMVFKLILNLWQEKTNIKVELKNCILSIVYISMS